jgi:hypothetical protein
MTRLKRLLYVCVGIAWAAAGLTWIGAGLVTWDGNKTATAAIDSAVGATVTVAIFTVAVGWFASKRRN